MCILVHTFSTAASSSSLVSFQSWLRSALRNRSIRRIFFSAKNLSKICNADGTGTWWKIYIKCLNVHVGKTFFKLSILSSITHCFSRIFCLYGQFLFVFCGQFFCLFLWGGGGGGGRYIISSPVSFTLISWSWYLHNRADLSKEWLFTESVCL